MKKCGEKVCQFIERYGLIPDGSKVGQPIKLFDQGYITFDASGALVLSDECPPMIPIQWGFDDKIGERLIDHHRLPKYLFPPQNSDGIFGNII